MQLPADNVSKQDNEHVDFVAAITHELKTSLTAIIASAELITDELHVDEGSVQWRLLQSIIRNAHRMNERVTSLSDMPRQQMQDFKFHPEPVDITEVIHNVGERIHPRIQSRRQTLALDLPDSLPLVRADHGHLEQTLLTLISNASKFSPEGGSIKVRVWQADRTNLVTQVSDTCGGIPPEEEDRVFEAHYQIQKSNGKGGLGLTIAKFLVELHGGKIWLVGQTGPGCSFFFSLPIARSVN
jgi:signal transduction histidine kinase